MEAMKTIHRSFHAPFKLPCYFQPSNLIQQANQGGAMNPRTKPTVKAPLSSLAAAHDPTPYSALTHDFQQLCSLAMDQAIGMEKASFDAVLQMQSCVIDACDVSKSEVSKYGISKYASNYDVAPCFTPALGNLFDCMAQAIASFMELQLAWMKMVTPHATHLTEPVLHLVAPARKVASSAVPTQPQLPPHVLEHSMDIAIGAHAA
jgi:hypothetical protein